MTANTIPPEIATEFVDGVVQFYITMMQCQEPLGAEFEAIWDAKMIVAGLAVPYSGGRR